MKAKNELRLERRLACHDERGICHLDLGDAPEAPDYTPIAQANDAAARLAREAAAEDLAFRRTVYNDSKGAIEKAAKASFDIAEIQKGIMQDSRDRSDLQWDQYTGTFVPIEQRMAQEAMDYGGEADQERVAGQAAADIRTQGGIARANTARSLAAMGVNPNSGRFASGLRRLDIEEAGAAGSAANASRVAARDKGISLRAGAAAFGRNQVNTAGQMAGISTGAGSAGVGSANAGANAGLPAAQFAAGGTGNAINASGIAVSGNNALMGTMSNDYRTALSADNSGFSSMLAGLGGIGQGLGAMGLTFSSKKLKTNKRPANAALRGVRNLDIENWQYKKGVADEGEHVGPYAEDVRREFGDEAAPGGKAIDVISMQGVMLKAIQELDRKVDKISTKHGRVIEGESRRVA